jgi:hypothetical protein
MNGLAGRLYASGVSPSKMERITAEVDWGYRGS